MIRRAIFIGLVVLMASSISLAQDMEPVRHITVSGHAQALVEPDVVLWNIRIERSGQKIAELQQQIAAELDTIVAIVDELEIPHEAIAASRFNVEKHYRREKHGSRGEFSHYSLSRSIEIEDRRVDRYEEALMRFLSGAQIEASPLFKYSAEDSLRRELKLEAVTDARQKAIAMAARLDTRIGPPLIISEYPIIAERPGAPSLLRAASHIPQAEPKKIQVQQTVYVRFELHPDAPGSQ